MLGWIALSFVFGLGVGSIITAMYGDAELNQQIRELRRGRYELAKAKAKYKVFKAVHMLRRNKK